MANGFSTKERSVKHKTPAVHITCGSPSTCALVALAFSRFSCIWVCASSIVAKSASAVAAKDDARQQAACIRPEDHRCSIKVLGRSGLDRLLAPHEQIFVDDLQMVKRLGLHTLHVVDADVDRIVDERPDACSAPECCSVFRLDPFFIQILRKDIPELIDALISSNRGARLSGEGLFVWQPAFQTEADQTGKA